MDNTVILIFNYVKMNKQFDIAQSEPDIETQVLPKVDYMSYLESRIGESLGRGVKIVNSGKRKKIEIEFSDNDDFETIIKRICGERFFDDVSDIPEQSGNV